MTENHGNVCIQGAVEVEKKKVEEMIRTKLVQCHENQGKGMF